MPVKPNQKAPPDDQTLAKAIAACIENGERLLDDAMQLEFQEPPTGRLALAMLAQEEFAKAFLLFLVREKVIVWSPYLLRAMNDHVCKQLVGTVIEYAYPGCDESYEEMKERISEEVALGDNLPVMVADAICILRHEKIGRWESSNWWWTEIPEYDEAAQRVAKGSRDRIKQDALYVRLGRNGRVASTPLKTSHSVSDDEYERAENYHRFVKSLAGEGEYSSSEYKKIRKYFTALFSVSIK